MRSSAAVKGGLHANYGSTLDTIGSKIIDSWTRRMAQELSNKGQFALRSVMDTVLGAVPGDLAAYWTAEIEASPEMGGKRNIVQTYVVNRNTTPQDVADIREALTMAYNSSPNSSPNLDRNPLGTR